MVVLIAVNNVFYFRVHLVALGEHYGYSCGHKAPVSLKKTRPGEVFIIVMASINWSVIPWITRRRFTLRLFSEKSHAIIRKIISPPRLMSLSGNP